MRTVSVNLLPLCFSNGKSAHSSQDFGYPQITSTEQLKSFIFHDVHMVTDGEGASKQATGSNLVCFPFLNASYYKI